MPHPLLVFVVLNLKGGTGKTTTSAHLLHALHDAGWPAAGIDADPQGSFLHWAGAADWPMPVLGLAERNLHSRLDGVLPANVEAVVVDTPPLDEQAPIVRSALRRATHAVIPSAPTPIEYERMPAVRAALADVASLRPDGEPPAHWVLLNRTVARAASTETFRAELTADGDRVLTSTVPRREMYAQAYGDPIRGAADGPFGAAVLEILEATE